LPSDRGWTDRALCREAKDPTIFDGHCDRKVVPENALAFCRRCPVTVQCLEYALDKDNSEARQGIWGGTTPVHRKMITRGLSRKKCPVCASVLIRREPVTETCLSCAMSWSVPSPVGLVAV
jgi:WhiB family transcriptional regulator, redox-sensing transcriptional regulator